MGAQDAADWNDKGVVSLEAEDFLAATHAFARAVELDPGVGVYAVNLSRSFQRLARHQEKKEQLFLALDTWARAGRANPDEGRPQQGQAQLLLRLGQRKTAEDLATQVVTLFPDRVASVLLLARLLKLRGDFAGGVALLETTLERHPEETRLQKRLTALRKEQLGVAGFLRDSSAHFDFLYDPGRVGIAQAMPGLINLFEQACLDVHARLGLPLPEHLLVIVLDPASYRAVGDSWSAGRYDGRIRLPVGNFSQERERLAEVARHEFAHATLDRLGVSIPSWFHEGIAQLAEGASVEDARSILAECNPASLADLDGDWTQWTNKERVSRAYATSLSFCAWLGRKAGPSIYNLLFEKMPRGGFSIALQETFSVGLEELAEEHLVFLQRR